MKIVVLNMLFLHTYAHTKFQPNRMKGLGVILVYGVRRTPDGVCKMIAIVRWTEVQRTKKPTYLPYFQIPCNRKQNINFARPNDKQFVN